MSASFCERFRGDEAALSTSRHLLGMLVGGAMAVSRVQSIWRNGHRLYHLDLWVFCIKGCPELASVLCFGIKNR